jgi:hypothetical protein
MLITRWSNRYQSCRDPQEELRMRLRELVESRNSLWLSTLDSDVVAGRLEGEYEANVPALPGGKL